MEITGTPTYSFTDLSGKRSFTCNNHNAFLNMMEGALTGKTGFTGDAGYCYVGAVKQDDRTFVAALLGCGWPNNKTYKWSDMKKLMEFAFSNYHYMDIAEPDVRLCEKRRGSFFSAKTGYGTSGAHGKPAGMCVKGGLGKNRGHL